MINLFYKIRWWFIKTAPKEIGDKTNFLNWNFFNKYYSEHNEYGSGVLPKLSCIVDNKIISKTNDSEQYPFQTGYLSTKHKQKWLYGKFELTCKVPFEGKKYWSAFWMHSEHWLPEVDIFEFMGADARTVSTTLHYRKNEKHKQKGRSIKGQDLSKGFHKYSLEWTPKMLKWYIDDVAIYKLTKRIPQNPMWLLINGMGDIRGGFIKDGEEGVFELQNLTIRSYG